jgi:hypothetical protein
MEKTQRHMFLSARLNIDPERRSGFSWVDGAPSEIL